MLYTRAARLFDELQVAHGDGSFARRLAQLAKLDMLVLDDFAGAGLPTLREVARMTGGNYHQAGTAEQLRGVYETLGSQMQVVRRETELAPLLATFRQHHPKTSTVLIAQAYALAAAAHEGQTRKSGEPYITHPLAVAHILTDWKMDAHGLAAALLHDTMEDTGVAKSTLEERFGSVVAELVDGLSKLERLEYQTKETAQAENFRKLMLAEAQAVQDLAAQNAANAYMARSPQERYTEAKPLATKLTAALGLRGFRLNLAVESAGGFDELLTLLPKIREAAGAKACEELERVLTQ